MRIATPSQRLTMESGNDFILLPNKVVTDEDMRSAIFVLWDADCLVVDQATLTAGIYAGSCLAHSIPFYTVGFQSIPGSSQYFPHYIDWEEFARELSRSAAMPEEQAIVDNLSRDIDGGEVGGISSEAIL